MMITEMQLLLKSSEKISKKKIVDTKMEIVVMWITLYY